MNEERTVYLIRHGHIGEVGGPKRYTGVTDTPLSATGLAQAQALADWFHAKPLAAVYCSYLSRSVQTASAVAAAKGLAPVVVPALHEIRMGEWEDRTFEEIRTLHPEAVAGRGVHVSDFRPAGGESFADCEARAWEAFAGALRDSKGDVAVVAHSGVNRVLIRRILGLGYEKLFSIRQDYGCVNIIGCGENGYVLRSMNLVPRRE